MARCLATIKLPIRCDATVECPLDVPKIAISAILQRKMAHKISINSWQTKAARNDAQPSANRDANTNATHARTRRLKYICDGDCKWLLYMAQMTIKAFRFFDIH